MFAWLLIGTVHLGRPCFAEGEAGSENEGGGRESARHRSAARRAMATLTPATQE